MSVADASLTRSASSIGSSAGSSAPAAAAGRRAGRGPARPPSNRSPLAGRSWPPCRPDQRAEPLVDPERQEDRAARGRRRRDRLDQAGVDPLDPDLGSRARPRRSTGTPPGPGRSAAWSSRAAGPPDAVGHGQAEPRPGGPAERTIRQPVKSRRTSRLPRIAVAGPRTTTVIRAGRPLGPDSPAMIRRQPADLGDSTRIRLGARPAMVREVRPTGHRRAAPASLPPPPPQSKDSTHAWAPDEPSRRRMRSTPRPRRWRRTWNGSPG